MARHTGWEHTANGLSKIEPFYRVFNRIRCRITDKSDKDYPRYGGKGLTFEWDNYMDFKRDMYEGYVKHCKEYGKSNTSIDRIDNSKGYSKENCRWATKHIQDRNKTTNRRITANGITMIVADWARKLEVSRQALRYRLEQGWSDEDTVKIPFNYSNRYTKLKNL